MKKMGSEMGDDAGEDWDEMVDEAVEQEEAGARWTRRGRPAPPTISDRRPGGPHPTACPPRPIGGETTPGGLARWSVCPTGGRWTRRPGTARSPGQPPAAVLDLAVPDRLVAALGEGRLHLSTASRTRRPTGSPCSPLRGRARPAPGGRRGRRRLSRPDRRGGPRGGGLEGVARPCPLPAGRPSSCARSRRPRP